MSDTQFKFEVEERVDRPATVVRIEGELRRGEDVENNRDWSELINNAKSIAKSRALIFDLSKLVFWDTRGITDVVGTVIAINSLNSKRAGIVLPAETELMKVANFKYKKEFSKEDSLIPSSTSIEGIIKVLES